MGFFDLLSSRNKPTMPVSSGYAVTINGQRRDLSELFNTDQYSGSAVLAACIDKIVETAGTTPAHVINPNGEAVTGHPMASLLTGNVNPDLSAHQFFAWVIASLCTPRGQAFAYIKRTGKDISDPANITGIYPIFGSVTPDFPEELTRDNPSGGPTGFTAHLGNLEYTYAPHEILWFRRASADNPYQARNPLKPAEKAVTLSHEAMNYLVNALTDGATAGGVLHLGNPTDPNNGSAGHDAALAAHKKMTGPANAKRIVYTTGDTKPAWIPFGMSPVDMELVQLLDMTDKQIVMALGVPRDLIFSESKYENREAAMAELWSDANLPIHRIIEQEFTAKVLPFDTNRMEFDRSEVAALQPRLADLSSRATQAAATNAVLVDEVRAMLNLPPLPDGAGLVLPAALLALHTKPPVSVSAEPDPVPLADTEATDEDEGERAIRTAGFDPATVQTAYDRLERRGAAALITLADAQLEDVLNHLERARSRPETLTAWRADAQEFLSAQADQPDVLLAWEPTDTRASMHGVFDPNKWINRTRDILRPWIERAHQTGADETAHRINVDPDTIEATVHENSEGRLVEAAALINATTAALIATILADQALDAIDDIRARISDVFADLRAGARAALIATTESVTGYNNGAHTAAAAVPADVTLERRWHALMDDRTRETHRAVHGHVLTDWTSRYPNGLTRPGDPTGPVDEVVNCRCVEEISIR